MGNGGQVRICKGFAEIEVLGSGRKGWVFEGSSEDTVIRTHQDRL